MTPRSRASRSTDAGRGSTAASRAAARAAWTTRISSRATRVSWTTARSRSVSSGRTRGELGRRLTELAAVDVLAGGPVLSPAGRMADELAEDQVEELADDVRLRRPADDEQGDGGGAEEHEGVLGGRLARLVVVVGRRCERRADRRRPGRTSCAGSSRRPRSGPAGPARATIGALVEDPAPEHRLGDVVGSAVADWSWTGSA